MIKCKLVCLAAMLVLCGPALAQEIQIGAFGQGAAGKFRNVDPLDGSITTGTIGGSVGFNVRWGNWFSGIEVDGGPSFGSTTESIGIPIAGFGSALATVEARKKAEGSVRLRIGRTFDKVAPFLTAGYSAAMFDIDTRLSLLGVTMAESESRTYHGFTGGGGVDISLTKSILVRPEIRYTHYSKQDGVGFRDITGRVGLVWSMPVK